MFAGVRQFDGYGAYSRRSHDWSREVENCDLSAQLRLMRAWSRGGKLLGGGRYGVAVDVGAGKVLKVGRRASYNDGWLAYARICREGGPNPYMLRVERLDVVSSSHSGTSRYEAIIEMLPYGFDTIHTATGLEDNGPPAWRLREDFASFVGRFEPAWRLREDFASFVGRFEHAGRETMIGNARGFLRYMDRLRELGLPESWVQEEALVDFWRRIKPLLGAGHLDLHHGNMRLRYLGGDPKSLASYFPVVTDPLV